MHMRIRGGGASRLQVNIDLIQNISDADSEWPWCFNTAPLKARSS
jgi:hypothetical protein